MAWRQLRLEAERACDDAVVGQSEPAVYADQLVMLAQRLAATSDRPLLAMAGRGDLAARVRAVLDTGQQRGRAGALFCVVTAVAGLVIGGVIAPLRAVGIAEPLAQRAEAADVTFEVASVRPNKTGAREININTLPGGRFVATNVPVRSLIRIAYGLEDHQIDGGPAWINADSFDIEAIAGRDLPEMNGPFGAGGALPDMLKSLLVDRFGFVSHVEVRELPVYHLVMAREDRRLGDDLKRSAMDCAALFAERKPGEGNPPCGVRSAPGSIVLEGMPVSQLASVLTGFLRRPVIDRTNLEGTYDLHLNWQMRQSPPPDAPPAAAPQGRTLFTALEDAAGMRLENTRGPQQVLIIDSVDQPSPN
jgi:uncharacterized protein (TIGR03435 family)